MVDKLELPFPLLCDPRGDLVKSLDLWKEEEGVSEPAIVVLDGAGTVRRLFSGARDFSDHPTEQALFAVLDEVGTEVEPEVEPEDDEPGIRVSTAVTARETVRPDKPFLTLEELGPYHLGTYSATVAMQKKLDGEAREEVDDLQDPIKEYEAAIRETTRRGSS